MYSMIWIEYKKMCKYNGNTVKVIINKIIQIYNNYSNNDNNNNYDNILNCLKIIMIITKLISVPSKPKILSLRTFECFNKYNQKIFLVLPFPKCGLPFLCYHYYRNFVQISILLNKAINVEVSMKFFISPVILKGQTTFRKYQD